MPKGVKGSSDPLRLEKKRAYEREWRLRNLEKHRERARILARKNRPRRHGITGEEYRRMWDSQGGVCFLCRGVSTDGKSLCIDHDHKTGQVRGLLCSSCNLGLGKFKDDAELLHRAAEYLESFKEVD